MELGISVAICTYNGARLLPKTLKHLANQQVPAGVKWEVLVIDNASTDNTQLVICDVWADSQSTVPLTVFFQPLPGLAHARQMALEKARYEFVLLCDDDNWLHPTYVATAYQLMTTHPDIGVLGGHGELVFESKAPLWARGHGLFANGPQATTSGKVRNNVVYGAGSVLRKSAYEKLCKAHYQPLLTDRNGLVLSAGGDYELCFNTALAGYSIWYDDRLTFHHFMPNSRLSWDYTLRLIKEGARSFESIIPYHILVNKSARRKVDFYVCLWLLMAAYALKWTKAVFSWIASVWRPEERKFYYLKTVSARAKLTVMLRHQTLYSNFLKMEAFAQRLRKEPSKAAEAAAQEAMPQVYPEAVLPV